MQFNQFYTESNIGDKLIDNLQIERPKQAFDLGFGSGALLKSAKRRWSSIKLAGVDIDPKNIRIANREAMIDALELNGFSEDLPNIIMDRYGYIDVLVSNPPFFQKSIDANCRRILNLAGLSDCISLTKKTVPAELIFLAQNLRLLSDNGEIGIILPAGLVSGERWKNLRELLFERYSVSNIIQLPAKCFKKTEAKTFILTISKTQENKSGYVSISHLNKLDSLEVPIKEAIERADYDYYECRSYQTHKSKKISLNDFDVFRGNLSKYELEKSNYIHIHSTDFGPVPHKIKVIKNPLEGAKNCISGDILIARVGSRCIGRSVYIEDGSVPISDCVIVIRPRDNTVREEIWSRLNSKQSKDYFNNSSLGVGAKYLTHDILQNLITSKVV